ncbi:unnamed protein product [Arctia plantaginis]|uniref:Sm domain-containing protein n=1 Tax=Arctia plantaginis TaxID=874455 RepID=A0A8S1BPH0_ARCPL|nr:unnamed protein product [Arctia plantaginis]
MKPAHKAMLAGDVSSCSGAVPSDAEPQTLDQKQLSTRKAPSSCHTDNIIYIVLIWCNLNEWLYATSLEKIGTYNWNRPGWKVKAINGRGLEIEKRERRLTIEGGDVLLLWKTDVNTSDWDSVRVMQYTVIITRKDTGIRGVLHATVIAFDKQWNLALSDIIEVWKKKSVKKRKIPPALGTPVPKGSAAKICKVPEVLETPIGNGVWECSRHVPQMMIRGEHVVLVNVVER